MYALHQTTSPQDELSGRKSMLRSALQTLGILAVVGGMFIGIGSRTVSAAGAPSVGVSTPIDGPPQPCTPIYASDGTQLGCLPMAPQPAPVPSSPITAACGQITTADGHHASSSGATTAAQCFYAAYQSCSPATLTVYYGPYADGTSSVLHLSISTGSAGCPVAAEQGTPNGPTLRASCASLDLTPSALEVSSCSPFGQLTVPH